MDSVLQDKNEVQHQISILLFVGLSCGILMLVFTRLFGPWALAGSKDCFSYCSFFLWHFSSLCLIIHLKQKYYWKKAVGVISIAVLMNLFFLIAAFSGPKNLHLVPAANTYVQVHHPCHL